MKLLLQCFQAILLLVNFFVTTTWSFQTLVVHRHPTGVGYTIGGEEISSARLRSFSILSIQNGAPPKVMTSQSARQLKQQPLVVLTAKKSDKEEESGKEQRIRKRDVLYRLYRVSTYPVRRVYRMIVPKEQKSEDGAAAAAKNDNDDDDDDDDESIKEDLEDLKELIDDTVNNIEEELVEIREKIDEELEELKEKIDGTVSSMSKNFAKALGSSDKDTDSKNTNQPLPFSLEKKKKVGGGISFPTPWPSKSPTAAKGVDLTGDWDLIVTDEFKEEYDRYLTLLGQPFFVRSVALSIVSMTTEKTVQSDQGASLLIRGQNLRGVWERTLQTAATDQNKFSEIITADGERVQCEAWWEQSGTRHHSWLRGVEKYGGGSFESLRYLDPNDSDILICESMFHPRDESREKARVTWRFQRKNTT